MHARTIIRNEIAQQLRDAGLNVFASRAKPLFDADLPAVLVYASSEQVKETQYDTDGNGELLRELEIAVECVAMGKDDLDDTLDTLAQRIEIALLDYQLPTHKNAVLKLKSTEFDMSADGNKIYGAVRLTFALTYWTGKNEH
jgi:hypothetical protein